MSSIKKIAIARYDANIKEPPYSTIIIDKMLIQMPENDTLGEEFVERIKQGCKCHGFQFKFYTKSSNPEFDYEAVVK